VNDTWRCAVPLAWCDHREAEPDVTGADEAPDARAAPRWSRSASDAQLAAAAAGGDRDAFDLLVERHRRRIYQLCYRFSANHADAADLTQEVFVRAYRAIGRFRAESAFTTWLHRIAVNTAITRVGPSRPATTPLDAARNVPADVEGPDAALLRDERRRQVQAALAELPPKQRATLVLRVYHELSHDEIAKILGRSVGTVKANLFFALRNLKARLSRKER
jgi:RNA polymerase sigma-70 factor (ECF subfamily)